MLPVTPNLKTEDTQQQDTSIMGVYYTIVILSLIYIKTSY